jgi:soluble lytic murein transglycosylase
MKFRICCGLLFFFCFVYAHAEQIDGKALLKKGRQYFNEGKYEEAITNLIIAEKGYELLGDYALLWLADAYHETGRHEESIKAVRGLLKRFPNTILKKSARIREITEAAEVSDENLPGLYESFLKDYPDEVKIKYEFARWLKGNAKEDTARLLYKELYIAAGQFSDLAYKELISTDISGKDTIDRAINLNKMMEFKKAENILRTLLEKDEEKAPNEILTNLGFSLFSQKRYREAAEIYRKAHDKYGEVRSLYRAGESNAFETGLKELVDMGDKKAGSLLLAFASDRRKDGKRDEAIKVYQQLIILFPKEAEDALWGIGWTYYLAGDYRKAAETFAKLLTSNNNSKYLYWKARSLEAAGEEAGDFYRELMKKDRDFYSIMAYIRVNQAPEKALKQGIKAQTVNASDKQGGNPPSSLGARQGREGLRNARVDALIELGFSREAVSELIFLLKTTSAADDLLNIGIILQDLGEYRYTVNLTEKLSCAGLYRNLCYPRAYWDTLDSVSKKHGVDPFLVLSVMREESRFDLNARSSAGALGLMQLMPQTAYRLDNTLKLGIKNTSQILSGPENMHLGTYYLGLLIKEFSSYAYSVAAYNAGEEAVRRWINKGKYSTVDEFIEDIPYPETRNYVKRVLTSYFEYKRIYSEDNSTPEKTLGNI